MVVSFRIEPLFRTALKAGAISADDLSSDELPVLSAIGLEIERCDEEAKENEVSMPAEGWFADPSGVPGHRYWDGGQWTVWVLRDGSLSSDGRGSEVPAPSIPTAAKAATPAAAAAAVRSSDSELASVSSRSVASVATGASVSAASSSVSSAAVSPYEDRYDEVSSRVPESPQRDYSVEAIELMLEQSFIDEPVLLKGTGPTTTATTAAAVVSEDSAEPKRRKGKFLAVGLSTVGVAVGLAVSLPHVQEMISNRNAATNVATKQVKSSDSEPAATPARAAAKPAKTAARKNAAPSTTPATAADRLVSAPVSTISGQAPNQGIDPSITPVVQASPSASGLADAAGLSPSTSAATPSSAPNASSTPSSATASSAEAPKVSIPAGAPPVGLVTEDLVVGNGAIAATGMELTVQFVGVEWSTGQTFDSSYAKGEPFTFTLGANEVISGWEIGLADMRVGSRRKLIVPSNMAYGDLGTEGVAGGETLVFIVDLVSAVHKA